EDVLSPQEHEEVYRWLYELSRSVTFGIKTTLGQQYRRVVLQSEASEGGGAEASWAKVGRASTNDGKGVCFVSHLGEVYPSGFLPVARGNVRRDSLLGIYRSDPVFQALRDPDRLGGKCGLCPFRAICGGCRARAYAYTGDYLAPDPSCVFDPEKPETVVTGNGEGDHRVGCPTGLRAKT
ncbi:MAG: SPASM domain-containing protein, partial [Chloroflexi bacterium]|nr:SPASM domain-containing protein [Chloroflexota bacterium]